MPFFVSFYVDSQAKWQRATQNFAVSIQVGSIITAPPNLDFANSATAFNVASPSLACTQAKFPLTAVIIDQLAADFPDPPFVSNANSTLQNHGARGDAVRGTHTCMYSGTPSPYSNEIINVTSEMRLYPQSEDHLTVSELIAETKGVSNASMSTSLDSYLACLVADVASSARSRS